MQKANDSLGIWAVWKIPPHSLKGEIECLIAKNFSAFRRISPLPRSGKLYLCRWMEVSRRRNKSVVTEKSPHSSKGRNRGGYRENFFGFHKNLRFAQTDISAFVQEDGSIHGRQQKRDIANKRRCPLSLFNATQFLRWVCLQKRLAIRYE